MSWKGRLFFRVYIKNKKHRYGIKIYKLCESNGVILKIKLYTGKSEGQEGRQTIKIVTDLLDDYLNKGYKVYTDNYYNSVELTRKMSANKTYLCGTLQSTRKGNPKVVTSAKLKKGEMIWRRKGEVAVCKWKDKRDVLTISNMHNPEMITIRNRRNQLKLKPNIVVDYNNGMGGVDHSDQMISYYESMKKTKYWYKKFAIHIFQMFIHNAARIHNDQSGLNRSERIPLLNFTENVIIHLLGQKYIDYSEKPGQSKEVNQSGQVLLQHYLEYIPPTEKKSKPTKPCVVCTKNKTRKGTRYFCTLCSKTPALCVVDCFKAYHN
ncbi:unnamed protein product [Parnassius mnemosyne]|uniref:Transposase n=1 Tax=Parnassius mnemosyne TaxID=213953 RepID=A0AAV1LAQ1_9NEOP